MTVNGLLVCLALITFPQAAGMSLTSVHGAGQGSLLSLHWSCHTNVLIDLVCLGPSVTLDWTSVCIYYTIEGVPVS